MYTSLKKWGFSLSIAFLIGLGFTKKSNAQPGVIVPGATNFFEGTITYAFTVDGEIGKAMEYINDIKFMTFVIKDGNYVIHLYGKQGSNDQVRDWNYENPVETADARLKQVFPTTRLFNSDSNLTYIIDAKNARAFRKDNYDPGEQEIPTATPTGDSLKILNVMCYAYKVQKGEEEIIHYVSPKYRVNMRYYGHQSRSRHAFMTHGLDGCIPLKTIRKNKERTITVTASKITAQKLTAEQFAIPPKFKILNRDYRR